MSVGDALVGRARHLIQETHSRRLGNTVSTYAPESAYRNDFLICQLGEVS